MINRRLFAMSVATLAAVAPLLHANPLAPVGAFGDEPGRLRLEVKDESITIKDGDQAVLVYHKAEVDPPEGADPLFKRSGFIHPVYTPQSLVAQQAHREINGVNRTHFCGAYWGFGFHEDGVKSALAVCEPLGRSL